MRAARMLGPSKGIFEMSCYTNCSFFPKLDEAGEQHLASVLPSLFSTGANWHRVDFPKFHCIPFESQIIRSGIRPISGTGFQTVNGNYMAPPLGKSAAAIPKACRRRVASPVVEIPFEGCNAAPRGNPFCASVVQKRLIT